MWHLVQNGSLFLKLEGGGGWLLQGVKPIYQVFLIKFLQLFFLNFFILDVFVMKLPKIAGDTYKFVKLFSMLKKSEVSTKENYKI